MTTPYPSIHLAPVVVLLLTMATADDEGRKLTTTTWTSGESEKAALRHWQKANPALAPLVQTCEVVTPKPKPLFRDHKRLRLAVWTSTIGERVEITDEALEACGRL